MQPAPQCASTLQFLQVPASHHLPALQSGLVVQSLQTPFRQPNGQLTSVVAYEQVPVWHVPVAAGDFKVFGPLQYGAGGVEQVTPAHGSPAQAPFAQPKEQ